MDAKLSNKVVLVTGASGGIGGELVRAFVSEGARVVAHFSEHGDRAAAIMRRNEEAPDLTGIAHERP